MNIDLLVFDKHHHLGENATGAIAHSSGSLAVKRGESKEFVQHVVRLRAATCCLPAKRQSLARDCSFPTGLRVLFLVVEVQSTSSSPLQGASSLASEDRCAGTQHVARNPCYTLARKPGKRTLAPVQQRILGLFSPL